MPSMEASIIEQLVSNRSSYYILRLQWEPEQVYELTQAIRRNRTVRYVFLYDKFVSNLSMNERKELLKATCCLPKLESFVYISNSNSTRVKFPVDALAEILRKSKLLTTFELHGPNLVGSLSDFDAFNHSLGRLKNLQTFKLMPVFFGAGHVDLDPLVNSLSKLETLEEIRLCFYCDKSSFLSTAQLQKLRRLKRLKVLDLRWPHLRDEHLTSIALELRDNTTLKELRIGGNDLVYGCFSLAEMLEVNEGLERISLACGGLGNDDCCNALWAAFDRNTSLKEITLENTDTMYNGAFNSTDLMRRVLAANDSIVTLRLFNLGIDDSACSALSKALQVNTTLRKLDLRKGNQKITRVGYEAMAQMLERNYTLQSLLTNATGSTKHQIAVCLKLNKSAKKLEADIGAVKSDRKLSASSRLFICCEG